MQDIIKWVSEARPDKDIGPAMTYYQVQGGMIRASNGKITAGHPWVDDDSAFVVSGIEFERVLARMTADEPTVTVDAQASTVTVKSGRFHASIGTLPVDSWSYPGVDNAEWREVPDGLLAILRSLRAFISDNPPQPWQSCVALESGNCYATNNIALAGSACDVGDVQALLPSYAIDFLLRREEGLESWAWNDNYVAFKWTSGAWLRAQLIIGKFPERAAALVREAYDVEPTQEITEEFREAFADASALAEDTVHIYADRIESKFKRSVVTAPAECEVPPGREETYPDPKTGKMKKRTVGGGVSIWGAQYLAPVISQATRWSPHLWPKPAPFRGDNVAGFVVGRKE
jgi:hypothetical protein